MTRENEPGAFDRLSKDGKKLFQDVEVRAMIRGIKPAVFLGPAWYSSTSDPIGVRDAFASVGVDAVVIPGLVGDRAQIQGRLEAERDLAQKLGWDHSKSIEENLADLPSPYPDTTKADGILGFVLGYPGSAIEPYVRIRELERRGVPKRFVDFFTPGSNPSITERIRDERGMKTLETLATAGRRAERPRDLALRAATTRAEKINASRLHEHMLREYEMVVRNLLRTYWNLTGSEIEEFFSIAGMSLFNASGEELYTFMVSGRDAVLAPDIIALKERLERTEGPINIVVNTWRR